MCVSVCKWVCKPRHPPQHHSRRGASPTTLCNGVWGSRGRRSTQFLRGFRPAPEPMYKKHKLQWWMFYYRDLLCVARLIVQGHYRLWPTDYSSWPPYRFLSWLHNVANGLCRGLHCGPYNGVLSTLAQAPSPVKFQPLWQTGGEGGVREAKVTHYQFVFT